MPRYSNRSEPKYLNDFLEQCTVPQLKELAGLIASGLPTRKADIIAVIHTHLTAAKNLRQIWQQLDELQQAAVAEVIYHPSTMFDSLSFQAKYGQEPDWGTFSRGYYATGEPSLLQLFFYHYVMPLDLKAALKAFVPPPRTIKISAAEKIPESVTQRYYHFDYETRQSSQQHVDTPVIQRETERAALQEINTVLRLIETGKIRASNKTNRVTKAGATAISQALYGGDFYAPDEILDSYDQSPIGPIKAFAWPLIVQSAGLAELAGTKLQLTAAGKKALATAPEKTIRTAWKKWRKSKILDEFNRVHTIKGQTGKGKRRMTAVSGRRAAIVQALGECSVNTWIKFDEFSRYMRASGHTFEVSRDLWDLYIAEQGYGSLGYEGFGDWHIVQARYMLAFLFEYVATLGLIDIAYIPPIGARSDYGSLWGTDDLDCLSRYDGLLYLRLNNLGAWCLDLRAQYVPPPITAAQILKVLPNLDIVATAPLPPGDRLFLEQFSTQTNENVWKLERPKLLQAVEGGQAITDIQKFLRAKSGDLLPNPVAVLLTETAERVTGLKRQGEAVIIEAKDEALAQLIANDGKLRSLCMLAGGRHIVVPKENESAFRRALRKLGYGVST